MRREWYFRIRTMVGHSYFEACERPTALQRIFAKQGRVVRVENSSFIIDEVDRGAEEVNIYCTRIN